MFVLWDQRPALLLLILVLKCLQCIQQGKASNTTGMKDQCYQFIKGPNNKVSIVGFGSYGQVKLGRNTETGQIVAIKMIHGRNAKDEIDVHHKLNHPNIIKLLNYYYEKQKDVTYMVLEYAEEGTLHNKIKFQYGQLSKDKVKSYFRDICKAVEYLHSLKYMHRDIKPENILLTKDGHAKLCDFGFAAILEYRSTLCGTYEYMAPEMILEKPYDYKVDIWALGILLFQLIQGTAPFRGENGQDVYNEMKKKNIVFSNRFEKDQIDLIKKILRVNAEKRPSVAQILQHPFVKENQGGSEEKHVSTTTSRTGSSISGHYTETIYTRPEGKVESKVETKIEQPRHGPVHLENTTEAPHLKHQQKEQKHQTREFKHYVPQGIKTTLNQMKNYRQLSTCAPTQPYQSFTSTSQSQNNNSSSLNPNTSIDSTSSSYRQQPQQTMQMPTFLVNQQQQRMPVNQGARVGYTVQTVPIGQPPLQPAGNGMGFTGQIGVGMVQPPNYWRKN